ASPRRRAPPRNGGTACETGGPSLPPSARAPRSSPTHKVRCAAACSWLGLGRTSPGRVRPGRARLRRSIRRAGNALAGAQAYVDLEAFGILAWVLDVERRIGALAWGHQPRGGPAEVFSGLEVARTDVRSEAIRQRHAQQRIGLQLRRCVQDARAHTQRAGGVRISGDAPLPQLIRG